MGSFYFDDVVAGRAIPSVYGYIYFYATAIGASDCSFANTPPTLFFGVVHTRPTLQVDVVLLVAYP